MEKSELLRQWIADSDNIVFFGGAGVSTESGIPDFRSVDGLYHQKYDYPPETILSHTFYMEKTEEFYRFYRDKMLALDAKPNAAHLKLAELEAKGKLKAVVTQNIDGLHQAAKSGGQSPRCRRQAAKMCWNFTAAYTAITAENAENCMMHSISRILPGFRCAVAVVRSNRMSYYMRKDWILPRCRQPSTRSARQKC